MTLPWLTPDGKPRTLALVFTGEKVGPCNRAAFNRKVWLPARRAAGIPDGDGDAAGMHQLRHHHASVLLRGGEGARAVDLKRLSASSHHSAHSRSTCTGT